MTNIDEKPNFFDEEYLKLLPENKSYLTLNEVLQMKILDENNESRINFNHIPTLFFLDALKTGKFYLNNFEFFTDYIIHIEKKYKRHELKLKLLGELNLNLLKEVFSFTGEKRFVNWMITILQITEKELILDDIQNNSKSIDFKEDTHSSITLLSKEVIYLYYTILDIKHFYNISFENFFIMLKNASFEMGIGSNISKGLINNYYT